MEPIREKERIKQNLMDAGCDSKTISDFFKITGVDMFRKQLILLSRHRKKVLDDIHRRQKQIDCLDYLIMQIEKKL